MNADNNLDVLVSIASLAASSVRWSVQKRDDMDIWHDIQLVDSKDIAERNMRYMCHGLISEIGRHRIIRRATFDFIERC